MIDKHAKMRKRLETVILEYKKQFYLFISGQKRPLAVMFF